MNSKLYLLKVRLLDIEPDIWRTFSVPANISLDRLHDVVQIVMGWTDSHLNCFTIGKERYTNYIETEEDGFEEGIYRLNRLVKRTKSKFYYTYDYGDDWNHEITLLDSNYFNPDLDPYFKAVCIDGARACPPEDVGGVMGYYELCDVIDDPDDEEYERMMEWSGGDYDSEKFDINQVNWELMKYNNLSRDRFLNWEEK